DVMRLRHVALSMRDYSYGTKEVAHTFVGQYYLIMYQSAGHVHRFYQDITRVGRPEEDVDIWIGGVLWPVPVGLGVWSACFETHNQNVFGRFTALSSLQQPVKKGRCDSLSVEVVMLHGLAEKQVVLTSWTVLLLEALELLAEVAILEEEIVRLKEDNGSFKQG
ncbi:nuclear transport factor 2, partial [Tanacetum coccineum]